MPNSRSEMIMFLIAIVKLQYLPVAQRMRFSYTECVNSNRGVKMITWQVRFESDRGEEETKTKVEQLATALSLLYQLEDLGGKYELRLPDYSLRTVRLIAETLCYVFNQEAIAAWHRPTSSGYLFGPRAEDWGPFDLSKF